MAFMPAVLVAAGIAVLSLAESSHMPSAQVNDKLVHGVMYLVLSGALMGAFAYTGRTRTRYYITTCALATLYGGLMELLQQYCTLTRSAEWTDWLADFLGAAAGTGIVLLIVLFTSRKA